MEHSPHRQSLGAEGGRELEKESKAMEKELKAMANVESKQVSGTTFFTTTRWPQHPSDKSRINGRK
jgi:hypothetical protein